MKHDYYMLTHVESYLLSSQFPLYTLMVFDKWKNGCPVVYTITSWSKQNDLSKWMDVINWKMQESKRNWKLNAIIVDDVDVEINSLRWHFNSFIIPYSMGAQYLICFKGRTFHVSKWPRRGYVSRWNCVMFRRLFHSRVPNLNFFQWFMFQVGLNGRTRFQWFMFRVGFIGRIRFQLFMFRVGFSGRTKLQWFMFRVGFSGRTRF
jgi:hypothetical protein